MHEYSIATSLLELVEAHAARRRADRVMRVQVRLGQLSGVEADLLLSAWELARAGTICREAPLEILPVRVHWACPKCGESLRPGERLCCPRCSVPARLEAGDELLLERIEMEVA